MEEERSTHSSILALENPWTEDPGGLQSGGHRVDTTEATEHIAPHFRVNTLDQHSFSTIAFYYMLKKKKKVQLWDK